MARTSPARAGKPLRATALRQDLYRILERIAATGEPAVVERNGRAFKITAVPATRELAVLPQADLIIGDPDDLVHIDWSGEWKP